MKWLAHLENGLLITIFGAMVAAVCAAVFSRYVLHNPLASADLIARFCFTWVTFLGAVVAVRERAHIRIDLALRLFPVRMGAVIEKTADALAVCLLMLLLVKGAMFVQKTWPQTIPPLEFSYGYFALAVPVSALLMLIHLLFHPSTTDEA